jgi:endonuclease/exonuclease/phosphatase (EEP) superfamily protein YafD
VSSPSSALDEARPVSSAPTPLARWLAQGIAALAILYPAALVAVWALLRFVGERWWLTGVALYLPMIGFGLPLPFLVALLRLVKRPELLWTQAVGAVILVFGLMGFVLPVPRLGAPSGPVVRVLSFNIDSARTGVDRIMAEIDRYAPDIAVLVEVGDARGIESSLKERYPNVVVGGQFALGTRYPVVSTREPDHLPYYGRLRSPRYLEHVLDTPLGRVALYVVHPLSPRDDLGAMRGRQGLTKEILSGRVLHPPGADIVQINSGLRTAQVRAFAAEAGAETLPVIIAGDTNLPSLSNLLAANLSGYRDGFREAGWGFGYTFPAKRWAWMRIDRILASEHFRFLRFIVGDSHSSDHRSVVADLELVP